ALGSWHELTGKTAASQPAATPKAGPVAHPAVGRRATKCNLSGQQQNLSGMLRTIESGAHAFVLLDHTGWLRCLISMGSALLEKDRAQTDLDEACYIEREWTSEQKKRPPREVGGSALLVGERGFEPPAPTSR